MRMITQRDYREILGITQEEAALLLKTTKSQIALFELGLRLLPAAKMLKLVLMHNHVQKKQEEKAALTNDKTENAKCIAMLEYELESTEIECYKLKRELEKIQTKYQKSVSAGELALYLETELPEDEKPSKDFIQMLHHRAKSGIEKNGMAVQLKCELALKKALQYQKELKRELERFKQSS